MAILSKPETRSRLIFIAWVALLSFGLPEVFAGSGANWLLRLDFYLLGMPLYALHFLLLCQLAIRTKRTNWPALYLFGVIFALYESWITKVIWAGYPGSDGFASGGFGMWFGVHETLALTFFYHPVTSFLLPLAVLCRLFPTFGAYFPAPDWLFGNGNLAFARRIGLLLMWGILSGRNMPQIPVYLITWLPLIVLLWLGYRRLRPNMPNPVSSPLLSRFGVVFAVVLLAILYGVTYYNILPEKLPPAQIQWLTLAFYPVLLAMIFWTRRRPLIEEVRPVARPASMPFKWLLSVFAVGLVVSLLSDYVPFLAVNLFFMSMILLGAVLFAWVALWQGMWQRGGA